MASPSTRPTASTSARDVGPTLYRTATGAFLLIFIGSVGLTSGDLDATRAVAFAGFFYDTLLALAAHLVQRDLPNIALATTGALATAAAYGVHRRRFPAVPPR